MSESGNILVCGVNWIGDTIMSMPALQAFRRLNPSVRITVLVKPAMRPLWAMHVAPDRVIDLEPGTSGTLRTATALKQWGPFDRAYVLPHSFRSALIPWLARIPERIGMPGHFRDGLLTRVIRPVGGPGRAHQAYEYMDLLVPELKGTVWESPRLRIPPETDAAIRPLLKDVLSPQVALIPGAARGPSKQWPAEHYMALGRRLSAELHCGILVLGAPSEKALCDDVAQRIGPGARSLAGRTGFAEWVALLGASALVVANDSGGMHVAAAVGTPVVALYGLTDPATTGPLTEQARVLQRAGAQSRDVARDSREARDALASISPDDAYRAALELIETKRYTGA